MTTRMHCYLIIMSPPWLSGRLIITVPTLFRGILNSQFVSIVDLRFLSAILDGI